MQFFILCKVDEQVASQSEFVTQEVILVLKLIITSAEKHSFAAVIKSIFKHQMMVIPL